MRVELSRVRAKPGKSACVDEWLKMLNDDMEELLQTLDRMSGAGQLYGFAV